MVWNSFGIAVGFSGKKLIQTSDLDHSIFEVSILKCVFTRVDLFKSASFLVIVQIIF